MSDAGPRWSEEWVSWAGYHKQWTQLARFALKSGAGADTAIEVDVEGGKAVVRVARRDAQGLTIDDGTLRARVIDGADTRELALRPKEPGLWDASIATQSGHTYTVEVLGKDDKVVARHGFAPPPSAEQRHRTPDRAWLAEVSARSGGKTEPEALTPTPVASVTADVHRLWPFFALFALVLLPLDAFLRRSARVV